MLFIFKSFLRTPAYIILYTLYSRENLLQHFLISNLKRITISFYAFSSLPRCKVTAGCEGAVEGAAPVDLGQCSWVGEQGHDHAVIIPLFQGAVSKRNGKCLWEKSDDERNIKLAFSTKEQK